MYLLFRIINHGFANLVVIIQLNIGGKNYNFNVEIIYANKLNKIYTYILNAMFVKKSRIFRGVPN